MLWALVEYEVFTMRLHTLSGYLTLVVNRFMGMIGASALRWTYRLESGYG